MSDASRVLTVPLLDGKAVEVEGEFPMTEQDWDQMMAVLRAMKPGLVAKPSFVGHNDPDPG